MVESAGGRSTQEEQRESSTARSGRGRGRRGGGRRGSTGGGRGRSSAEDSNTATGTTTGPTGSTNDVSLPRTKSNTTSRGGRNGARDATGQRHSARRRGDNDDGGRGRGSDDKPASSGGRGRGRGRGRGGRGRGRSAGRGRGRSGGENTDDEEAETDPYVEVAVEGNADQQRLETGFDDATFFIGDATTNENEKMESETAALPPAALSSITSTLSLPSVPAYHANMPPRKVPMILTRNNAEELHISERLAAAALEDDDEPATAVADPQTQVARKAPLKKKKKPRPRVEEVAVEAPSTPAEEVSTTDAIRALPAQEVSITSASLVRVRKIDSTDSLAATSKSDENNSSKIAPKLSRSRKKKGLTGDDVADQKAARHFNRDVRTCVERSDPDAMRELLRDKRNHNFALDAVVLETVLKAYIMAAMFDDALYCLRNCTLPSTLSTIQAERILLCLPQNLRNSSAFTAADMINALCIATEFDVPTKRTYFLRIVRGIALEFLEEATSARDRICSAPCERLVRSAQCVVDSRLKRGKKPTEIIVDPGSQLGVFVPDTMENRGIQAGDAVSILPYAGPYPMSAESLDRNMIEATVTNTNPMVLRLQDKTNSSLYAMLTDPSEGNVYRIDKLANRMGFNRQLAAAVAFVCPLPPIDNKQPRELKRPSPELIKAVTAMDENIDLVMERSGGFNSRMTNGEMTSTAALCSQPVPWNVGDDDEDIDPDSIRDASRLALEKYGALEGLNASQSLAVEGAATNRLTLVQGPPGTGKTQVAIRIIRHWAKLASSQSGGTQSQPFPILATSDSNIAVDNLVEGCASAGLRVIRLGRPEAIRPELLRFCIDRPPQGGTKGGQQANNVSVSAFKEKVKAIRNAQVICCTCIGSGGDILENMVFERVLVDEATQATEPAVLVPLARGCRQLVLVGDHCQLPPTVLSPRAEEEGLGVPLFSRMVACGVLPFMLDTQYRMHPAIAMFPSDLFYGGKLANGVSAPERRPLAGFPWPREEFPVAFVPVHGGIEVDDGVSKLNEAEAAAAYDAVEALLKGGQCRISDIAVVTPYAAQARLIRRMLKKLTQSHQGYVEVSSVDGFQGREKEAVVFSAVRSNAFGGVGFVKDWRRVNVSFTRARRALIVIGNDQTLRRGDPDTWMPWLAWADAHGINMDKPGTPRGRYEPEQLRRVRGGTTAAEMLKDVLQRQQAQLKTAKRQLEDAERNAAGHIIGKEGDAIGTDDDASGPPKTLEEDLADLATDNWDDSDSDTDDVSGQVISTQPTLSAVSSLNDFVPVGQGIDDGPRDAWDL